MTVTTLPIMRDLKRTLRSQGMARAVRKPMAVMKSREMRIAYCHVPITSSNRSAQTAVKTKNRSAIGSMRAPHFELLAAAAREVAVEKIGRAGGRDHSQSLIGTFEHDDRDGEAKPGERDDVGKGRERIALHMIQR